MNTRSLELFKALTEASFWFYTHPKETSYRIIYNKSRYTMDKERVLKLLRLYVPYVRRLDDTALIQYMYRNGGIIVAQAQSGQLAGVDPVSDLVPNTLQNVTDLDLEAQQKAIDEAVAQEEEEQKKRLEEKNKKTEDQKRKEDDQKKDKKTNQNAPTESNTEPKAVEISEEDEYSAMAENLGARPGTVNQPIDSTGEKNLGVNQQTKVSVSAVPIDLTQTGNFRPAYSNPVNSNSKPAGSINPNNSNFGSSTSNEVKTGPSSWERMIGNITQAGSGQPIINATQNLASKSGIFIRRQGVDRLQRVVGSWLGRNPERSFEYQDQYVIDEEEEWISYPNSEENEREKKGWMFLGLGLGWWIAIAIIAIMFFSSILGTQDEEENTDNNGNTPVVAPGSGADYSACKFTRAGTSKGVGSTTLAGWIRDAADKEGIPPAVLMSVAMHENPIFTADTKNDHDSIMSGQMCNKSPSFCVLRGQVLHTKAYSTGENDPCTASEIAGGAQTAQAVGLMQFLDIYNPDQDLCSIQVSLRLAAAKLKGSGIGANPTQSEIEKAIKEYHGSCLYSSYNYCQEVYQDLKNCQPKEETSSNSCEGGWPTTGPITKGPYGGSHSGYRNRNMQAVDIGAAYGTPVYATITGVINELSYIDTGPEDGKGRGIFVSIQANKPGNNGKPVVMRYLHFSQMAEGLKPGQQIIAGALIGYVGSTGYTLGPNLEVGKGVHLHMDIENGTLAPPYVPTAILPVDCEDSSCRPQIIRSCK